MLQQLQQPPRRTQSPACLCGENREVIYPKQFSDPEEQVFPSLSPNILSRDPRTVRASGGQVSAEADSPANMLSLRAKRPP